jgi:hypothetical protein
MTPEPSNTAGPSVADPAGKKKTRMIIRRAGLMLALCGALLVVDGRMAAMIRFTKQAHVPGLNDDFKLLPELLPQSRALLTELRTGLPHPFGEPKAFVRELWLKPNRSIKGYRFYKRPEDPTELVRAVMVDLLSQQGSFSPYIGPKQCGGYHADFAAKLEFGSKHVWLLVCLGCKEVLIYSDEKELICEMRREVVEKLEDAWRDQLGIPHALVGTRLPLPQSLFEELGLRSTEAHNLSPEGLENRDPSAVLGKVYLRMQRFYRSADKRAGGRGGATIELHEEIFASPVQAEQRAKEIEARIGAPPQNLRRKFEDGFALGNRVYRMMGWTFDLSGGVYPDLLLVMKERLRRHCEETPTHEVRFYD